MWGGAGNQDDHTSPATQWPKNEFCLIGMYTPRVMIFSVYNVFYFPMIQQSLFWTIHHPSKAWGMWVRGGEGVKLPWGVTWRGRGPGHHQSCVAFYYDVGGHLVPGCRYPSVLMSAFLPHLWFCMVLAAVSLIMAASPLQVHQPPLG